MKITIELNHTLDAAAELPHVLTQASTAVLTALAAGQLDEGDSLPLYNSIGVRCGWVTVA